MDVQKRIDDAIEASEERIFMKYMEALVKMEAKSLKLRGHFSTKGYELIVESQKIGRKIEQW